MIGAPQVLSISKITAASADGYSRYLGRDVREYAAEHDVSIEEADRALKVERAHQVAASTGEDPEAVLKAWDQEDEADSIALSEHRQSSYYAVQEAASDVAQRRLKVLVGEDREMTQRDLADLMNGRAADGDSLRDPGKLQFEKIARLEGLHETKDLSPESYAALRQGLNPETGQPLTEAAESYRAEAMRWAPKADPTKDVTAADLTFSAPKTVSLLMATASVERREEILSLHEEAVVEVLKHAQEAGLIRVKRGTGRDAEYIRAELQNVVGKTELSSRARDPQLHTHTILSTAVLGEDGRVSSLDLEPVYGASKYLGTVYRRVLCSSLAREYGLEFEVDDRGLHELKDVSREEVMKYSNRSREIRDSLVADAEEREITRSLVERDPAAYKEARARVQRGEGSEQDVEMSDTLAAYEGMVREEEEGRADVRRRQRATKVSRDAKAELSEEEQLKEWQADDELVQLGRRLNERLEANVLRAEDGRVKSFGYSPEELKAVLTEELAEAKGTFTEKDVRQFVAEKLDGSYPPQAMQEVVEEVMSECVTVRDVDRQPHPGDWARAKGAQQQILTTEDVLKRQQRVVATGADLVRSKPRKYRQNLYQVDKVVKQRGLNDDQQDLVVSMTSANSSLVIAEGVAGSGKTYALGAGVQALQEKGFRTIGLSTKAKTATDLLEAGCDQTYSLEKFLLDDRGGIVHDNTIERGLPTWMMLERSKWTSQLAEAKRVAAATEPGSLASKWRERQIARLEQKIEQWDKDRAREKEEFRSLNALYKVMSDRSQPQHKRDAAAERYRMIKETNPHVKVSLTSDRTYGVSASALEPLHLLVDEAGMASDEHLDKLLQFAAAEREKGRTVKITMVGDTQQLASVQVGSSYDALISEVGCVTLGTTVRARQEWEARLQEQWHRIPSWNWGEGEQSGVKEKMEAHAERMDDLKRMGIHGGAETEWAALDVLAMYEANDRVTYIEEEETLDAAAKGKASVWAAGDGGKAVAQERAAQAYLDIRDNDKSGVVMAATRAEVAAVNKNVQEHLLERGELDDTASREIVYDAANERKQTVYVGDQVLVRKNQNREGLLNGMTGRVERFTDKGMYLKVEDEHGQIQDRFVSNDQMQDEAVQLGYAVTVHASQGVTVDEAVTLVDASLTNQHVGREHLYVGMTRGRDSNRMIAYGGDRLSLAKKMAVSTRDDSPLNMLRRGRGTSWVRHDRFDRYDHAQEWSMKDANGPMDEIRRRTQTERLVGELDEAAIKRRAGEQTAARVAAARKREEEAKRDAARDAELRKQMAQGHGLVRQRIRERVPGM